MMEHLNFTGRASQEELGRGLAKMHLAEPTVRPAYSASLNVTSHDTWATLPRLSTIHLRAPALQGVGLLRCCHALDPCNCAQDLSERWPAAMSVPSV